MPSRGPVELLMIHAIELVHILFVFLTFALLVFGADKLTRKALGLRQSPALANFAIYAFCCMLFAMVLGLLKIPSVWLLSAVFALTQLWGLKSAVGCLRKIAASARLDPMFSGIVVFVAASSFLTWEWSLFDVAGLPSAHDGLAHMHWFMRIIESGNPFLFNTTLAFGDQFGEQTMVFYPTGTHAFWAAYFWPYIKLGLLTPAEALKAVMVLLAAAPPVIALLGLRSLAPRQHPLIFLVVGMAITGWMGFPCVVVDNGGFSRLFPYVLLLPAFFYLLAGSDDARYRYLFLGTCITPTFMFHPAPSGLIAGVALTVALFRPLAAGRSHWWQTRAKDLFITGALLGLSASLMMGIILYVGLDTQADDRVFVGTWWKRSHEQMTWLLRALFKPDTKLSMIHVGIDNLLLYAGILGLFSKDVRSRLPTLLRYIGPFLIVYGILVLFAGQAPQKYIRLFGGLFHGQPTRVREAMYIGMVCLWFVGAVTAYLYALKIKSAKLRVFGACVFVFLLIDNSQRAAVAINHYIYHANIRFFTPLFSTSEALMQVIREKTEPDSVFLTQLDDTGSVGSRTGRQSMNMFLQCYATEEKPACKRRHNIWRGATREIMKRTEGEITDPADCVLSLVSLTRPAYIIQKGNFADKTFCKQLQVVAVENNMTLFKYIKAPDAPR